MATTPVTPVTPAVPPAPPVTPPAPPVVAASEPGLKIGAVVRLKAVFGTARNPFTGDWIEVDDSKKVVVDAWILSQFEGGKLALSDD